MTERLEKPYIILDYYGSADLSGYLDAVTSGRAIGWDDIYPRLDREVVSTFNPHTKAIPDKCANVSARIFNIHGVMQLQTVYSFGEKISADTARSIAHTHVPDVGDNALKTAMPDDALFFLSQTNGVGFAYAFTLALYGLQGRNAGGRPVLWQNPEMVEKFAALRL